MNKHESFSGWVSKRGGHINPCLNLFNVFPDGSRGIAAKSDIPEADLLILMPMKACIHTLPEVTEEVITLPIYLVADLTTVCPAPPGKQPHAARNSEFPEQHELLQEGPSSSQLRQFFEDLPQSVGPFLRTTLVLMHHLSQVQTETIA